MQHQHCGFGSVSPAGCACAMAAGIDALRTVLGLLLETVFPTNRLIHRSTGCFDAPSLKLRLNRGHGFTTTTSTQPGLVGHSLSRRISVDAYQKCNTGVGRDANDELYLSDWIVFNALMAEARQSDEVKYPQLVSFIGETSQ